MKLVGTYILLVMKVCLTSMVPPSLCYRNKEQTQHGHVASFCLTICDERAKRS